MMKIRVRSNSTMYNFESERFARLLNKFPALSNYGFSNDCCIMVNGLNDLIDLGKEIKMELIIDTARDPVILRINDSFMV